MYYTYGDYALVVTKGYTFEGLFYLEHRGRIVGWDEKNEEHARKLIPSKEYKINMYSMDFDEFLWAIGDEVTADTIRLLLENKRAAGNIYDGIPASLSGNASRYVVHTKDYKWENGIHYLPVYMIPFL